MKITEIVYGENEIIFVYHNIFITNKVRFLNGIIYAIAYELESGKDISIDLESLLRDIEIFEVNICSRLNNAKAEDKDVKENTATFYRAIADNFKKKHAILAQIFSGGEREIPQILLAPIEIKIFN